MSRKKTKIPNIMTDSDNGKYYATFDYGVITGKRIRTVKTFNTKTEAKRALEEFKANKIRGTLVNPNSYTVEEWLEYWLEKIVKNKNAITTYQGYKIIVKKHVNPKLGYIKLQKLTARDIQLYYDVKLTEIPLDSTKSLSVNTILHHHTLLKLALGVAVRQKIIISNPIMDVLPPQKTKVKHNFYDIENIIRLFDCVKGTSLEPAVYLAGLQGLRRAELSGLKWEHVDLDKKILRLEQESVVVERIVITKNSLKNKSSEGSMPISDFMIDELLDIKNRQEKDARELGNAYEHSGYIVVDESGHPINPSYLSSKFFKFIKKNNLSPISFRGLRHTVATVANDAGLTLYDISKILRHSSPQVTGEVYTHLFKNAHQENINIVAEHIRNLKKSNSD